MSLCGDYGGLTAKGEPCRRTAGWGVPDTDTGRCKTHLEQEPEARTITAPVGYAFEVEVEGELAQASAVTLTPFAIVGIFPPPPDDDEPPPPDDDDHEIPPDDPDEPDMPFGWLAPQPGEVLSGASVELVARSPVEPQWRLVGKGGWHAFQDVGGMQYEWESTLPTGAVEDGVYTLELQAEGQGTAAIMVRFQRDAEPAPPPEPPPPPPDLQDPPPTSEGAAFVLGPQVPIGESPWPFFDENHAAKAAQHHQTAMSPTADIVLANYYDLGLCLYVLYNRSRDPAHLAMAREVTDRWHERNRVRAMTTGQQPAPRNGSLSGVMLRALDGRPDMWQWMTAWQRLMWPVWLGARLNNDSLWQGIRDGGYTLLYTAQFAQVHPDAAVRSEARAQALAAARDYYARLQRPDGGWYWFVPPLERVSAQPFMHGMLLEGMIATHQLTGDAAVGASIVRACDWLFNLGYEQQPIPNRPPTRWRAMKYFIDNPPRGNAADRPAAVRDERQLNPVTIHAFGYAYQITGDTKYRDWGDEIFAATFGKGRGPDADVEWGLADFRAKEYSQSYRTAGRYLAWREAP